MKTLACLLVLVSLAPVAFGGRSALAMPCQQDRKALLVEFGRRYRAIDQKDAAQLVQLGQWCFSKKLKGYGNRLFKKALKIDPQNDAANEALGNVRFEGKWHTPAAAAELRAKKAAAERAAKAAALGATKAAKLTPPDEPGSRAEVERQVTEKAAEAKRLAAAYVTAIGGQPKKFDAAISKHFAIVAKARPGSAKLFAQIAEYVYRRQCWITFGEKDAGTWHKVGNRMHVFLTDDAALEPTMDYLRQALPQITKSNDLAADVAYIRKQELIFMSYYYPPVQIHLSPPIQGSATAFSVARMWLEYHAAPWWAEGRVNGGKPYDYSMMLWMLEGLGTWASLDAVGVNRVFSVGRSHYANEKNIEKDADFNYDNLAFEMVTTGKVDGRAARHFAELCRARLRTWHVADIAMSYSLVDYLMHARQADWRGLIEKLAKAKMFRVAFISQFGTSAEQAQLAKIVDETRRVGELNDLFDHIAERFEKDWKSWVERAYERRADDDDYYRRKAQFPEGLAKKRKG